MTVHVGEMHTDISQAGPSEAGTGGDDAAGRVSADEHWAQSCDRAEWLTGRTAATGFDD